MQLRRPPKILEYWREFDRPPPAKKTGLRPPTMMAMRGSITAPIFMLAPPCDSEEYEKGEPMTNANASVFHNILLDEANLDTNTDVLVVSCSRFGLKPNKASTEPVREFLQKCLTLNTFNLFICVGDEAFKHIFGRGIKSSMASLAGNVMYVPETNHKPLFVFPSLDGLYVQSTGIPRDDRRIAEWSAKTQTRFQNLAKRLREFIEHSR